MTKQLITALHAADATLSLCAGKLPEYAEIRRKETLAMVRAALSAATLCNKALDFIERSDPFGDEFSEHEIEILRNFCLTAVEQASQASRCACRGTDEYCPCQNTPDCLTLRQRLMR